MTPEQEAWKAEEQRQAQLYAEAMHAAIANTTAELAVPLMSAIAGALIHFEEELLASCPSEHARGQLVEMMAKAQGAALDRARKSTGPKAKLLKLGVRKN